MKDHGNINSQKYWERKFKSGKWGSRGRKQTLEYAKANISQMSLPENYKGTILDFGCALGDAIPIYYAKYTDATICGYDISKNAIAYCQRKYSQIAMFYHGSVDIIPEVDVIVASHVMEHISGDKDLIRNLLLKCKELYVFVPFMESPLYKEHVNCYDHDYYNEIMPAITKVFQVSFKQVKTLKGDRKSIV